MRRRTFLQTGASALAASTLSAAPRGAADRPWEWRYYGGDQEASRYAPLSQITPDNVRDLEVAWVHKTGDAQQRPLTTNECTPIVIDGVMFISTSQVKAQALDAATGKLLWTFDPFENDRSRRSRGVNRGLTYFQDGKDLRIFLTVHDRLYCLDGHSGKPVAEFGDDGALDMTQHFDRDMEGLGYKHTSPVVVWQDMLLVGGGGFEGPEPAAPGHVRGYDVRTGKRRWIFHTIPWPGEFGYETWPKDAWRTAGGANNWGGMSLDPVRGWLFVSLGSPAFDFWGGDRIGKNLFGNCVLALDANTGERLWHFQTTHHDVWDYDLPAQPILGAIERNGQKVELVMQVTKTGLTFVLDRLTGAPVFGVEERPVPASDVPGEQLWPTQPFPVKPPPLSKLSLEEQDISDLSPESEAYIRAIVEENRIGPIYTPPSLQGTIIRPGFSGGALWGGGAFDPRSGYLYVNTSETANMMQLAEAESGAGYRFGHTGYRRFFDQDGRVGLKPPWGFLTCIDMVSGDFVWREVLGEDPDYGKTGTRMMGGSIATAGGVVFIGATQDEKFRAFDSATGRELWSTKLSAGGYATPCSYEAGGKQYVVIAAGGGGKQATKAGDEIVAFALPG